MGRDGRAGARYLSEQAEDETAHGLVGLVLDLHAKNLLQRVEIRHRVDAPASVCKKLVPRRLLFVLVGDLTEIVGADISTVSKHLSVLRNAHLIDSRKQGRWMYYRLADQDAAGALGEVLAWTLRSIADTERFRQDTQRLEAILAIDPEILCSR